MSIISTHIGRGSVRATAPLTRWRTVDLLTVAFLGAAFGIAYWGWGLLYSGPANALAGVFAPLQGITGAPWLIAGVVGGLVVRRPGAALLCEVIAAVVEMLPGSQWGFSTLMSGIFQGLGAARSGLRVVHLLDRLELGIQDRLPGDPHRGRWGHRGVRRLAHHQGTGQGGRPQRLPTRPGGARAP